MTGTGDRAESLLGACCAAPGVTERGGTGAGQRPQRAGIGGYRQPSHDVVRQKLTQHHKANIVQFLKIKTELYFYTIIC